MGKKKKTKGYNFGGFLQGISPLLSAIPGAGVPLSLGASVIGNKLNQAPSSYQPILQNDNSNPYGYATGGILSPLNSSAVKVKANNPSLTDSVKVDHDEIISQNKVFSDDIIHPKSSKPFSKEAEKIEKAKAKVEKKFQGRYIDAEAQNTLSYLNQQSDKLFEMQEIIARNLGLRDRPQDSFQTGGRIDPEKPFVGPQPMYGVEFHPGPVVTPEGYMGSVRGPHSVENPFLYNTFQKTETPGVFRGMRDDLLYNIGPDGTAQQIKSTTPTAATRQSNIFGIDQFLPQQQPVPEGIAAPRPQLLRPFLIPPDERRKVTANEAIQRVRDQIFSGHEQEVARLDMAENRRQRNLTKNSHNEIITDWKYGTLSPEELEAKRARERTGDPITVTPIATLPGAEQDTRFGHIRFDKEQPKEEVPTPTTSSQASSSVPQGKFGVGDFLQATAGLASLLRREDKTPEVQRYRPLTPQQIDATPFLDRNQANYQAQRYGLDTSSFNVNQGLKQAAFASKLRADSDIMNQISNQNKQFAGQADQFNINQHLNIDEINARRRAGARNLARAEFQHKIGTVSNLGQALTQKQENERFKNLLLQAFPVGKFLQI